MDIMEIILLIVGGVVFVLSFFIPDKKAADIDIKGLAEDEVRAIVSKEVDSARSKVEDLADKTERYLEKLSNEKIMAVEEYSDTVLAQIHKNHEEAVFLYDMLNNKQTGLKSGLAEINRAVKEAKETAVELEKLVSKTMVPRDKEEEKVMLSSTNLSSVMLSSVRETGEFQGKKEAAGPGTKDLSEDMNALGGILSGRHGEEDGHNNNEKILGLYRQGKNAAAIAKELGLGVGEVRLVLELFQG